MEQFIDLKNRQLKVPKTAVSAAILRLAFCAGDITNKISMCGKSVYYVTIQPFLLFAVRKKKN